MILKIHIKELNEEILKYVEIGHRGCLRLKELVDNLLDVSRLEAKKFDLELQKENLVEIIIDCANDMKYLSSDRQLIMNLNLPHESYLNIDKLRFRQVLTNLISNAIKNTPKKGKIMINLIEEESHIDIHIKDTGVGFTLKEKEKLFQKFGKIERYGMDLDVDIEGSGLGLFISKEIVELHGGQIFMESEGRNEGATFTVRLLK
jgi:signal transduction histidine kinase